MTPSKISNSDINIIEDSVNKVEGTYNLNYTVTNKTKIDEDISNAVLKSTLTEEESNKLDNIYDIVRTRLESK